MEEPVIEYNLQTPCYDIDKLISGDTEDVHVIDKYDSNLILVKYNKKKINDDNWETLGKFRSLIYDKNANRVISYFPPKSCIGFDFGGDEERYLEEFYEGTMISLFWYDIIDDWEITTRSNIGAKCSYKPGGETFRTLFLNTLNKQNIEFEDFDKNFCYTFVKPTEIGRPREANLN